MKELYNTPEVELVEFDKKDVVTTSGTGVVDNGQSGWSELH